MDYKEPATTSSKPGSVGTSKRVQFSRSKTDVDLSSHGDSRQTKSARLSSRRSQRQMFGEKNTPSSGIGSSPRQQMILRMTLKSRESRRSKEERKFRSPSTDYKRMGSVRSYDSSVSMARKERDAKLRFKLKLWTHTLVYFQKLHQKIIRKNQELEAFKKQMDYTEGNFVSSDDNAQAGLDVDYFKPVTKIRMSKKAKRILLKDPNERTEEEIRHVRTDLMVTKTDSIQTLPEDCQLRLAKNVGLESLGAKRFIIKEGYTAEYCYLIIVGSVIRAWLDEGAIKATSDDKPLKEGRMFGESEVNTSSPRKASYISASYTEILRVSAEDYYDIFMAGEKIRTDDLLLLRHIDVFNGWDLEKIQGDREKIKRKYFPNNWLVRENEYEFEDPYRREKALDTRTFEWIYVVKSGSLQIMKTLEKVNPTINLTTGNYSGKAHTNGYLAFLTKGAEYERFAAYHATKNRPLTAASSNTSQQDLRSMPLLHRLATLLRPHTTVNEQRLISTPDSLKAKKIPTSALSTKLISIPKQRRQSILQIRDQSTPTNTPETQYDEISSVDDRVDSTTKEGFESRLDKTSSSLTDYDNRRSPSRKKHVTIEPRDGLMDDEREESNTLLCRIKTLTKGDVFGLEYIVFDEMDEKNQPGFLIKSNGCECLMIHKKVYKELIKDDFDLKEKLRSDVSPYPEETDLEETLLLRINWELHKDIFMKNLMKEKARLKPQKHGTKYAPVRIK